MREEARRWWDQGEADLAAAEHNLRGEVFYLCAFMSHQAAEKALKALHIEAERRLAPPTHSLVDPGRVVGVPEGLTSLLRQLTPAYVNARYPDAANGVPAEIYDQRLAEEHLAAAREVMAWVRKRLSKPPS